MNDTETVIRFVPSINLLEENGEGEPTLSISAFSKTELLCKDKDVSSASLLRGDLTSWDEVLRRASARNRQDDWKGDPVLARAITSHLRQIVDKVGRREACVFANPINDDLGNCSTHAYVRRADPPLDLKQRVDWQAFRLRIAEQFSDIKHHSGAAVTLAA